MNYVSYAQLVADVKAFSEQLPKDYDAIIGIPRSGMLPASLLSLIRNVTLSDSESLMAGRFFLGGQRSPAERPRRILVIDDSVLAGKEMRKVKSKLQGSNLHIEYACVYVKPGFERHVDHFYKQLPTPRIFEWNLFHGYFMQFACLDIDGVICRDPTRRENDDGVEYEKFIKTVKPRLIPTKHVAAFVTSRLEKYRDLTETWLWNNGFLYNRLVMHPAQTGQERRDVGDHAQRKASVYKNNQYQLFVESSEKQAKVIYEITKKPVLCTDTGFFYA